MRDLVRGAIAPIFLLLLLAGCCYVFRIEILRWSAGLLQSYEPPQKADIIVVIGGDYSGGRILKAAELARAGYAPHVLSSGLGGVYGRFEGELAIDFAVQHGFARSLFILSSYPALSTRDEARGIVPQLRRMGVHKYLLVTGEMHTARAGRDFRQEGGRDLEVHVVAARDEFNAWWRSREGRKRWLMEMSKTMADHLGI